MTITHRTAAATPHRRPRSHRSRTLAGAGLAAAVIVGPVAAGSLLAPTVTSAAAAPAVVGPLVSTVPPHCTTPVLAKGHVDLAVRDTAGGGFETVLKDETAGPAVYRKPSDVVLGVNDELKLSIPDGFEQVAPVGSTIWMVPQTQNHRGLWAGFNTERVDYSRLSAPVDVRLESMKGPDGGRMVLFLVKDFGATVEVHWDTARSSPGALPLEWAQHIHTNLAFTAPGTYETVISYSSVTTAGTPVRAEARYTFHVGGNGSGGEAACPSPEPTPEPTPTPEPSTPEPSTPAPSAPAPPAPNPVKPTPVAPAPKGPDPSDPASPKPAPPRLDRSPSSREDTTSAPGWSTQDPPSSSGPVSSGAPHPVAGAVGPAGAAPAPMLGGAPVPSGSLSAGGLGVPYAPSAAETAGGEPAPTGASDAPPASHGQLLQQTVQPQDPGTAMPEDAVEASQLTAPDAASMPSTTAVQLQPAREAEVSPWAWILGAGAAIVGVGSGALAAAARTRRARAVTSQAEPTVAGPSTSH